MKSKTMSTKAPRWVGCCFRAMAPSKPSNIRLNIKQMSAKKKYPNPTRQAAIIPKIKPMILALFAETPTLQAMFANLDKIGFACVKRVLSSI